MNSSLMGGEQLKLIFDKYLIRLKSLILMNGSHNYTSTTVFDTLTNGCGGSLIEKRLNLHLTQDR